MRLLLLALLFPLIVQAETLSGGLLFELTGPAAANGTACKVGLDAAQKYMAPDGKINGQDINLIFADSQRDARVGLTEFKKLVDFDKITFAIVMSSPVSMAINPVSKQKGIPILGIAGHADFVNNNPFAYRFWLSAIKEGEAHAVKLAASGKRRVAVVTLEDEWTLSVTTAFKRKLQSLGGQIVSDIEISAASYDAAMIFTKIKSFAPEAIFINLGIPQLGSAFRKIHDLGIEATLHSNAWAQLNAVRDVAGPEAMRGVIVTIPKTTDKFLEMMGSVSADESTVPLAFACYSALASALEVLKKNPEVRDAESFQKAMQKTSQFDLPDGKLDFKNREAQFEVAFMEIR